MTGFFVVEEWQDGYFVDSILIRIDGDFLKFYAVIIAGVPYFEEPQVLEKVYNVNPGNTHVAYLQDWPMYEMVSGEVEKTVPAGTFTAMEIDMWDDYDHDVYVGKKWMVDSVGLIGYEVDFYGTGYYQYLTSYTYVGGTGYWPLAVGNELIYETGEPFLCGDVNDNGLINILDVTYLLAYLYQQGSEPIPYDSGDVNSTGSINILDITYLLAYIYQGGPEPNCP
jgi:hypothetical protein